MSDLKIDYSLTKGEVFLFPFVPVYGLRRLEKEGWENKILGTIELCPLLGPVVAIVDYIVAKIFEFIQEIWEKFNPSPLQEKVKVKPDVTLNETETQTDSVANSILNPNPSPPQLNASPEASFHAEERAKVVTKNWEESQTTPSSEEEEINDPSAIYNDGEENPETSERRTKLAVRWVTKIASEVSPEIKMAHNLMQSGKILTDAYACHQEGDTLGAAKKVAPLVVGGALLAVGGAPAAVVFGALKLYGIGKLIYDTVKEVADDDEKETEKPTSEIDDSSSDYESFSSESEEAA